MTKTPYLLFFIMVIFQSCSSLQFTITLTPQQRFCFYEVFELHQKYTFVTTSIDQMRYEVDVSHIDDRNWKSVFFRTSQSHQTTIRVDKLAAAATTYSFCVKNLQSSDFRVKIEFGHGIDVLEFNTLPDATDAENLDRELNWLQKQTNSLAERSQNIEGLRRINEQINGMVGTKMIIFAVLGLLAIGGVNVVFYKMIKEELKKRKLI